MAWRLYFLPTVTGVGNRPGSTRAKYLGGTNIRHAMMTYGSEPVALVAADVTPAQHASIIANGDVLTVPVDLDSTLTAGAVSTAQTFLESLNIPAGWVNTSLTYRQVVRTIAGLFQFVQRWAGLGGGRLFGPGVNLSLQFNELPQAARDRLLEVADSFSYDVSGLTATSTLRQILKTFADAWGAALFYIGDMVL